MPDPRRQGRHVLAGVLMMAILVATAVVIFFLDQIRFWLQDTYSLVAVFREAPGLRTDTPVWVAGVPAGRITRVDLLPPGDTTARVAVVLELNESYQQQIRRDSRVRLTGPRMIGEKVVELLPGTVTSAVLRDGDTIRVRYAGSRGALAAEAQLLRAELDSLRVESAALAAQLDRRGRDARRVLDRLSRVQREMDALSASFGGGSLAAFLADTGQDALTARAGRAAGQFSEALDRLDARARELSGVLGPGRESLARHARELRAEIGRLRALLAEGNGTLPRLQRDSAVWRAYRGAQAQLDSLVAESGKIGRKMVF